MSGNSYIMVTMLLILVSLVTILYNTYIFKKDIEGFEQREMFQNEDLQPTHSVIYPQTNSHKKDDSQPLKKYHYIKESVLENLQNDLSQISYVSSLQFYSVSIHDIHQKIADDINKVAMKTEGEFIEGPVYTIVCQDDNSCYSNDLIDIGTHEELTSIFILYPRYYPDHNGKILKYNDDNTNKGISEIKSYFEKNTATDMLGDVAIVYQLNNKNKLFHNLKSCDRLSHRLE